MLDLEDSWVWDFWVARDGTTYHCFFLKAPRSIGDPDRRHHNASVGHAVSADLVTWTRVVDALDPQPAPGFDDLATWTGCVVRGDDGAWHLFTSGLSRTEDGLVQRVGAARSRDLMTWQRCPEVVLEADPRWYAVRGRSDPETHWRDPWVLRDDAGQWHLLVTAKAANGWGPTPSAVVGHATSDDLTDWQVQPPLTTPSRRFEQAEVVSVQQLGGRWVLVFSCLSDRMPYDEPGAGGVWCLPVPGPGEWAGSPSIDLDAAVRLTGEELYVGRLVQRGDGEWCFLAFANRDAHGDFVGGVSDPMTVAWRADGRGLVLPGVSPQG